MKRIPAILALAACLAAADPAFPLEVRLDSPERQVATAALAELARNGAQDHRQLEILRMRLGDDQEAVRLAAAGAAARLHDDGAIPGLIQALRNADPATAEAYRSSLTAITGSDRGGGDAGTWGAWHDGVTASTETGVAAVRDAVAKGDADAARAALHPLLMQRACRDVIAGTLAEIAKGDNPRMAALAREGLASLGGPAARLALDGLGDPPEVAAVSEAEQVSALRAILTRVLPPPAGTASVALWLAGLSLALIGVLSFSLVRWARKYKVTRSRIGEITRSVYRAVRAHVTGRIQRKR